MGEVVSFAKARQADIFSMFDSACPALAEETNRDVLETAERSVDAQKPRKSVSFRTACLLIASLSVIGVATSYLSGVGKRGQLAADLNFSADLVVTEEFTLAPAQADDPEWRQSREAWLAHIAALENNPYYQQVMREKRLFSLTYPDRQQ
jgi:hypothetical protein